MSHTKDAILFRGTEEEELEKFLAEKTQLLKSFAKTMRKRSTSPWSKEKLGQMLEGIKEEFGSNEMHDAVTNSIIPPIDVIERNNQRQVDEIREDDLIYEIEVGAVLKVRVILQDRSENDPYVAIVSQANGYLALAINERHPYYQEIDSEDRVEELIKQYIYDAIAEFRVRQLTASQQPDAIRKMKDILLRVKIQRIENKDDEHRLTEIAKLNEVTAN